MPQSVGSKFGFIPNQENGQDFIGNADELIDSRTGTPFSVDGHRDYVRKFRVLTNNKLLGSSKICKAPGIPKPFSSYVLPDQGDSDLAALMISVSEAKEFPEDWQSRIVTCGYSTTTPQGGAPILTQLGDQTEGSQNSPDLERPLVRWDAEVITRALQKDLDGNAFLNSAGQPFSPAPTFETARAVLMITRNELSFDRAAATNYAFAVNSDVFLGVAPGCVRCNPIQAEMMHRGSIMYFRVNYRLVFGAPKAADRNNQQIPPVEISDPPPPVLMDDELESWQPSILDAGVMQKATVDGRPNEGLPVPIVINAVQITHPVLLDGQGRRQIRKKAGVADPTGTIDPVYLDFRVYKARPFNKILEGLIGGV